ncbi:citrate lyase subunit beta / citryl-CoA lyase [Myroides marinus]|uniref:Citrate lyase subunit beta / citryl-CoA lyase n=1 Tax=Myroides marinus TaxID=703342 RepID=A0A1H6XJ01_9FLAO|nr:CoA ester lyase [Myroides marinus]SEJ29078.1 citrate lyase subunit beta / citryl-CoA lyase [Myroides marinus]
MRRDYLLRSLMFVPSHNRKLMESASRQNADVLLLDIEDSVQPLSNKKIARAMILEYLESGKFKGKTLFPRVNDRESGELLNDVLDLTVDGIEGFMYPKAKTGEDVYFFDKLLEIIEYQKGIEIGTFKIIPLIETSAAVLNVQDICKASARVIAIAYGSEDFITDLEGNHDIAHDSLQVPRAIIAMGARANDVIPIDTVHVRVHDLEDLEVNLKNSVNLGFEGMLVLNPKELPLVHQYYSPTDQDVLDAREMLTLAEEAANNGEGVAIKGGKFIGPPMIKAAKKILLKDLLIKSK